MGADFSVPKRNHALIRILKNLYYFTVIPYVLWQKNDNYKYINNYYHYLLWNIYINSIITAENSNTFFFFFDSENNWKKIKNSALSQEGKTVICTINSYNTVQTYVISFKKWTIGRMRLWMSERRDTNEVGPPTGAWLKTMFPCGTEK